jgi:murein L,D-transpeptidase YafK
MRKRFLLITALCLGMEASQAQQMADQVLVDKSESRLYLLKDSEIITSFRVRFGSNPKGHKQQQGDGRTPEGRYILDYKNINSAFYKSIHISYPNAQDRKSAWQRGVDPGGDIMIHGQANGWGWFGPVMQYFNWTDGCIALRDRDMETVWKAVRVGTPIVIRP